MASKKKRGGRDDFGFDDDLDFDIPDFTGDNPAGVSKDRKPISTGLKSAAAGFGKTFTSEARLRKTLTKSLPKEYEEPISKAFEIKDGARDLYNIASTQVNETVRETKRSVGRIARNLEGSLPRGLAEKLKKFGDSADSGGSNSSMSKDEIENGAISSAFAGIFAESIQNDADNRKKDNARKVVQDSIDKKRHQDMTTILGSIDQSLIAMQTHQEKVGNNYMKKALELQFRTYFVQNDILQLQTKFFQEFKDDLSAITKNTGLPDFVKKAPKEALLEHLREKTFDSLSNSISKRRSQWMSGVVKKAGQKITDVMGSVREGMGQVLDTAEMASSMHASGMGPSGAELVGDLAGGYAGNKFQDAAAKRVRKWSKANPNAVKFGNKLAQGVSSAPQWVNDQMQNGKFADKIPDWFKDLLSQETEGSGVRLNKEIDLERAAQFTDKNSRSINVVIPELLAKIHHELYVTRTGDTSAAPLAYDFEKGKFVPQKERQQALLNSVVSKRTVEQTKHQSDSIFKEIDPNNTLDKTTRDKITENLYGANKNGVYFNKDNLRIHAGDERGGDLIKDYIERDSSGANERRLSKMAAGLGANNGEVGDYIQSLIDSGRHGELADLGLLDLEKGTINMDAVRRMELGKDPKLSPTGPTPPEGPSGFGKRRRNKQSGFINLGIFGKKDKPAASMPGNAQDLGEVIKAFKEATESLSNIKSSGGSTGQLKETLEKVSGKSELMEIRDILKRIEEKGIGGGVMSPEMLEQYMSQKFGGFFGKAGNMASGAAGKFGSFLKGGMKSSWNMTKGLAGFGKKGAMGAGKWLASTKDRFDLFIGDEVKPRLDKAKLEAGKYVDAATGKVITKFEDIQGDIKDIDTGEVVLYITELRNAVLKNLETGKSILVRGLGWAKKAATMGLNSMKASAKRLMGMATSAYGTAWAGLKKAYDMATDGPMDVYLKDSYETPVLLKRIMEQGLYFDKDSLDAITKVSQIKGPVVDNENNVLITKEDLHNGLYDKKGQEIKTGFDRVLQFVGNSIKKTLGTYKKMLGKAKDMGSKAMAWMKGLFGFDSPFTVFSKHTNDILTAIYNLLNDRMPGERSPDLDTVIGKQSSGGAGGGSPIAKGAHKVFDKAKDKLKDLKSKHWKDAKDMVDKKTGRIKDGATLAVEKLTKLMDERLPEAKKKIFGDTNGDGVRDGSIDDLRSKRQKAQDALKGMAGKAGDKIKGTSAYGALADLLKKKKKDGEGEDKEKDGDTFIDMGGDGDKKGKDGKPKKPRGKLGRGWDKLKGKMTPKGNGALAKTARVAGKGAGLLGRGALALGRLGLAGAGMLLGGGLSSVSLLGTAGSLAMGGLSMIGTVLGVGASVIGAIISSPITVPALAIAAAGTAAYFTYKWLTKPDPQPIEKVRLVQYGWKATDLEAYKKMKTLEQQVAGSVIFQGEKAEFDPKRLNMQEMMKTYGLDPQDKGQATKFIEWFANRFRPVYLNHRALIKTTNSPKELADVDDNKAEFKKTYLEQCAFPGAWYSVVTSPFKDQVNLFTTQYSVNKQIDEAKAEVEKTGDKKTEEKAKEKVAGVATASATAALQAKIEEDKRKLEAEQKQSNTTAVGVPAKITDNEKYAADRRMEMSKSGGMGPGAGSITTGTAGGAPGTPGSSAAPGGGAPAAPGTPPGQASPPKSKDVKPKSGDAIKVKAELIKNMPKYGITTANQQAAILGNIEHESGFQPISENLNYKAATLMKLWPRRFPTMQIAQDLAAKGPQGIANSIYGNRMGNTEANDGWDYRGRGPIQITGKSNYAAVSKIIGKDLVKNPDQLVTDPVTSAESALAYWKMNPKLGKFADAGNFAKVREMINGGTIGADAVASSVASYLQKIKSGELTFNGSATSSGAGGTITPTDTVPSPKPTTENVASSPNTGPTPSAYVQKQDTGPATPAQMVASPRPTYDPSSGSASSAPVAQTPSQNAYIQQQSSVNTGDSISIMKDSLTVQKQSASTLDRIATLLEGLPRNTAEAIAAVIAGGAAKPAPSEGNNYGKPAQPMPQTSNSFRRSMAGT